MSNTFIELSPTEKSAWISRAAEQHGLPEVIIEKDFWICWVLENLFELPIQMVFKGGTSLSKAFNLINRFSEDVDVTIDYSNFRKGLDFQNMSGSALKKLGKELINSMKSSIVETVLPHLQKQALENLPKNLLKITLDDDGEKIHFHYQSVLSSSNRYLRDHVLIEFGGRNTTEPCEKIALEPYLSAILDKQIKLPKPVIEVLSPVRTFWEKVTLIHAECHRDRFTTSPDRLSRHWYDLFMLEKSWVSNKAISSNNILIDVVKHKEAFFSASYTHFDDCLNGKFRLLPDSKGQKELSVDYANMVDAGMFHGIAPSFEEIMDSLKALEKIINRVNIK